MYSTLERVKTAQPILRHNEYMPERTYKNMKTLIQDKTASNWVLKIYKTGFKKYKFKITKWLGST
jgi:hypothetical protein